jgi:protocatechuate 3,4-dioxygenase beta subunit
MRTLLTLMFCCGALAAAHAAGVPGYIYKVQVGVNLGDRHTMHFTDSLAVTDPDETTHILKIDKDLHVEVRVWSPGGRRNLGVTLIKSHGAVPQKLASLGNIAAPSTTWAVAFSVCGDRIIALPYSAAPGRCADLPQIAKLSQGSCRDDSCIGPFEGMPAAITSRARIAPLSEPGEPLTISGRVFGADAKPRAGIIVYAYHTNRLGVYPRPDPPRSEASNFDGSLRGWARTDDAGRYTFETIRPGSYPNSNNPQHVHMYVVDPGCATYFIKELQFTDDPMYQHMKAVDPKGLDEEAKAVTPRRTSRGWDVTRDIDLAAEIPNYKACKAAS